MVSDRHQGQVFVDNRQTSTSPHLPISTFRKQPHRSTRKIQALLNSRLSCALATVPTILRLLDGLSAGRHARPKAGQRWQFRNVKPVSQWRVPSTLTERPRQLCQQRMSRSLWFQKQAHQPHLPRHPGLGKDAAKM